MSAIFLEKAIWGFFALVGALIAVIYKLFNGSLIDKAKTQKLEIKSELTKEFEEKFGDDIDSLKIGLNVNTTRIDSLKKHGNANSKMQMELLNRLLDRRDEGRIENSDDREGNL